MYLLYFDQWPQWLFLQQEVDAQNEIFYPCYFVHLTNAILRTISILHYTIIYACYDALMPIKLFDYTIQLSSSSNLLSYSSYKLQIPKLWTIDTKLTKYWYKTYELLIQNLRTTNPFCYKLQILNLQSTNPCWYKLQILILQTTNPIC